jgi:F420H(2)-dependent quinone reductase
VAPARGRSGRTFVLPRWALRTIWTLHRAGYALSGGRLGLRSATPEALGTLELRTLGRRTGDERAVMLFYLPQGEGFAVVASNAGATYAPAWWLNLQAHPDATVAVPGRTLGVRAREAGHHERTELWDRFVERLADYRRYAEQAERDIPIVILEPIDREPHA